MTTTTIFIQRQTKPVKKRKRQQVCEKTPLPKKRVTENNEEEIHETGDFRLVCSVREVVCGIF